MKHRKSILILSILTIFLFSCGRSFYSAAYPDTVFHKVEWNVKEGDTFTWVVKNTIDNFNLLPVNSKYILEINSIRLNATILGQNVSTYINATLTRYNSGDKSTTVLLNNSLYIMYYDDSLTGNYSFIWGFGLDQGFITPSKNYGGFMSGIMDNFILYNFDNVLYAGYLDGTIKFLGLNESNHLRCVWDFNEDFVTENLIFYNSTNDQILYELVLSSGANENETISFGSFFLIPIGIILSMIIYLTYKKLKFSKKRDWLRKW